MPTPVSPGQGLAHKNSEASDNILANQSVVHSPPASPSQQMTSPQPAVSPSPRPIIATDKWETVEQTFVLDALKSPRLRRGTYTQTSLTPSEQQKSSGKLSSKRPSRLGHVLSKRPRSRERGPLKQQKRPFLSNLKRSRSPEQLPPMSQQNLEHMPDVPHGQDSPPQTTGGRKSEEEVPESPLKRPRSGTPSHVAETPAVSVTPPNFHETPAVSVMPPNSHGTSATNSVLLTPRETPATNPMRISSILLGGSEGPLHDRFKMLKSTGPQPRGSPHQQADGLQPQTEVPGPKIQQPKEQQSGRQQDDDLVLDEEKSTPRPENPEIINPRRKSRRIAELSEADKQLRYEEKQWERRAKERAQELKIAGLPLPTLFPGPDQ
ncbi:hypothetical protein M011DRAFT_262618 [Sporormia fimetaria CBS 119925]|uniref:Uncharacterized protein n=1 Tax=Sporormia fimetaria CBS 119925 TaxID=1340428 RepID=A0A6A6UWE9_9PLEO|nr:hypothetical protein M011DRAFT_262618 [Sporormia fimetaria CBS 119925]